MQIFFSWIDPKFRKVQKILTNAISYESGNYSKILRSLKDIRAITIKNK